MIIRYDRFLLVARVWVIESFVGPQCTLCPLQLDFETPCLIIYSAMNINCRDAEFAEALSPPYHNSPSDPKIPSNCIPDSSSAFVRPLCALRLCGLFRNHRRLIFEPKKILLFNYDLARPLRRVFSRNPLDLLAIHPPLASPGAVFENNPLRLSSGGCGTTFCPRSFLTLSTSSRNSI